IRPRVVEAIGMVGDEETVRLFLEWWDIYNMDTNWCPAALRTFARIGSPIAIPKLKELLSDNTVMQETWLGENLRIADLAAQALRCIKTPEAMKLFKAWFLQQHSRR
ncbi:MAG: hypothetical protein K8S97_11085, partial [Anaerolineae bacterium]|nr:hypothetical protein [Anaerolineae bacterium]